MYDSSIVDCAIPLKNRKTECLQYEALQTFVSCFTTSPHHPSPFSAGHHDAYVDAQYACHWRGRILYERFSKTDIKLMALSISIGWIRA